jgi:hypothetical protein
MWFGADQLHALFTWTFYLLGHYEQVGAGTPRLDEGSRPPPPTTDDITSLPCAQALKESMRVIQPVWGFFAS